METMHKAQVAAQAITRHITSLREVATQLATAGRQQEAEAIHLALDGLQKSLKRIRVDEDGKVKAVH